MNEKNACTLPSGFVSPWALAGVPENVPVLVGFSGGADSMALLHMLYGICHKNGAPLYAVHVNHQIRGAEADRDEEFCRLTADSLGIPLFVCHRNVPELARKKGVGTEVAAREARYACFEALMAEKKIPLLAVAHHADDNLETMLFHMSRGSGLTGISGIPPSRPLKNGTLTRPLLRVPAEDIRSYCQAHGLDFVTDSTNSDTGYARNRLRAGAVPVLCAVNAGAVRNSARTAELLRRDDDCLSGIARQWLSDNRRENLRRPVRSAPRRGKPCNSASLQGIGAFPVAGCRTGGRRSRSGEKMRSPQLPVPPGQDLCNGGGRKAFVALRRKSQANVRCFFL